MRILLINPPRFNGHAVVREMRCANLATVSIFPPIELAYLAGVLRQYAEVKILDANALDSNFKDIEIEIRRFKPQAVVFTISPTTFTADAQIAKIAKEIDGQIKTILLDSHISPAIPERVRQNFPKIDYLVSREPLLEIPGLLGFPGIAEIENHPLPAYDLLPLKKYFSLSFTRKKPFATLITSVGCPNRCNFCIIGGATVDRGYGKIWKFKSPSKILEEIKHLLNFGVKSIYFFDETFTADRERIKSLCGMIIENRLKFEWSCNGRADTLDEETIKTMGAVDFCQKNGIKVAASFMLGMPEESMETVKQTLDAAKKINPHRAQFVILTPYPGTKLYDEEKEKGLLVEDYSFSGYDGYCAGQIPAIRTKYLTSQELVLAQKYIYRKFYLRPSLWLKTILSVRNFGQLMNVLRFVK